jgi:hypothetical protein
MEIEMARTPKKSAKKKKKLNVLSKFSEPNPEHRELAASFAATGAQTRSKVDVAHWYITVIGINVNFDAPLSTVRQGTNINFGLAQECNQYQYFAADRLNLQKSDVSTASSVGQFYQDILARYGKNGWTLT